MIEIYGDLRDAIAAVRDRAGALAQAEQQLAEEYLLRVATGKPTWEAQKMAEVAFLPAVTRARAEYEIALVLLKQA